MRSGVKRERIAVAPGEDAVARAAVLILRAILPAGSAASPDRVRILPDEEILSDQAAAARLASMARPLACRPAAADGVLELACAAVSPGSRAETRLRWAREERERRGSTTPPALGESGDGRILIVGRGEELVLSPADRDRLEREFVFEGGYGVVTRRAVEFGYDPQDVSWVQQYGPPAGATRVVRLE